MKIKLPTCLVSAILVFVLVLFSQLTIFCQSPKSRIDTSEKLDSISYTIEDTEYSPFFTFDNNNMTVENIYSDTEIWNFTTSFSGKYEAKVFLGNTEIVEGVINIGMTVKLWYDKKFIGEYQVKKLETPYYSNSIMSTNSQGYISPFAGKTVNSSIISSGYMTSDRPNHTGVDFWWSGIRGTPVRAVKSGVVIRSDNSNPTGWG